jgi:hypothetical protein
MVESVPLDSLPFDAICSHCGHPVTSDPAVKRSEFWRDGHVHIDWFDAGCYQQYRADWCEMFVDNPVGM